MCFSTLNGKSGEENPASVKTRSFLFDRKVGKQWETGDVKAGAQKPVVDEELCLETYDEREFFDCFLCCLLTYGEDMYVLCSAEAGCRVQFGLKSPEEYRA